MGPTFCAPALVWCVAGLNVFSPPCPKVNTNPIRLSMTVPVDYSHILCSFTFVVVDSSNVQYGCLMLAAIHLSIYNITKYRLPKSHHMTKCQKKNPAEIQCGNRLRMARLECQGKKNSHTMFAEILLDKQPKCEAKMTGLSIIGPHS